MIQTSDINELLEEARSELKRADHLVFVSLKYTRTVDVIKNVIERLINGYELGCQILLENSKNKGLIKEYPSGIGTKIELLTNLLSYDAVIQEHIRLFVLLRKLNKAEFSRMEEYRRHVRMIATIDTGEVYEIKIDTVKEYYEKLTAFINTIKNIVSEKKDD